MIRFNKKFIFKIAKYLRPLQLPSVTTFWLLFYYYFWYLENLVKHRNKNKKKIYKIKEETFHFGGLLEGKR